MDHKEFSSLGGKKTSQTHDKAWYQENQRKSVESRKRNKQLKEVKTVLKAPPKVVEL